MSPPVAQIGAQHQGLCPGKTSPPDGVPSSVPHRLSRGTLLKIPPGASPPLPKCSRSPPPISVWIFHTPQKSLAVASPFHVCNTMGMWLTLVPPLRPPGLSQTVISLVRERNYVQTSVPQFRQWQFLYGYLHLSF